MDYNSIKTSYFQEKNNTAVGNYEITSLQYT